MIDLWDEKDRLVECLRAAEWDNPEGAAARIIERLTKKGER